MDVDTMRRIDVRAGIPLCALATLLSWPLKLFRRSPPPPKRALFVGLSELGSVVLAGPAMRKAQAKLGVELFFVIFETNKSSVAITGIVPDSNVFVMRSDSLVHLAYDTIGFLIWVRKRNIDTVVDLELFSRFTALLTGCSGADRKVGFYRFHNEGLYRGEMLTHRVGYNPHMHITKNFVALVDALLSAEPTVPYSKTIIADGDISVWIPPADQDARTKMIDRIRSFAPEFDPGRNSLVLINPNASDLLPQRRWMPDRFAEIIRRTIAADSNVFVLITGAASEREGAEKLSAAVGHNRCISFAGKTSLTELPALYGVSALMLTNDSGPAHFAAASGLATIVLFGPETPKLYGPLGNSRVLYAGLACSPCASAYNHRKTACTDNICMQAISVDAVFAEMQSMLAQRPKNPDVVESI
jgi:ADP-heptose:LPS heptosyltransferase